jgi:hypothetical protein
MTGQNEDLGYMTADGRLHLWSLTQLSQDELAEIPSQLVSIAIDEARTYLESAVDWDWTSVADWMAMVMFLDDEWNRYDPPTRWTVESLADRLRELQMEGWGERPVVIYNQSNVPVPHLEEVSTHHNTKYGHIVLSASQEYEL